MIHEQSCLFFVHISDFFYTIQSFCSLTFALGKKKRYMIWYLHNNQFMYNVIWIFVHKNSGTKHFVIWVAWIVFLWQYLTSVWYPTVVTNTNLSILRNKFYPVVWNNSWKYCIIHLSYTQKMNMLRY